MNKIPTMMMSFVLLGAAASSVACGAADMGGGELGEEAGAEDTGVVEEAVAEPACGTMACTSANSCTGLEIPAACVGPVFKISTLPYGSVSCPSQYVVQDTTPPTNGGNILAMGRWKGATLTAANCATAKLELAIYSKTPASGVPVYRGKQTFRGVWNGGNCVMTSTEPPPKVSATAGLQEVRVTGSASLGATPQRVDVGYWHTCS